MPSLFDVLAAWILVQGSVGAGQEVPEPIAPKPDLFGEALCLLDDLDQDGVGELLVGCPRGQGGGSAWLFSGKTGKLIRGHPASEDFPGCGIGVSALGDVDEDGSPDYLIAGKSTLRAFSGSSGKPLWIVHHDSYGLSRSHPFARVGDSDLDGVPDIAVGAPLHSGNPENSRTIRIRSGRDGSLLHTITGPESSPEFGTALDEWGDLDGDGCADFLVGVPAMEQTGFQIRSGRDGSVLKRVRLDHSAGNSPRAVARAGDLDKDGVDDVVMWVSAHPISIAPTLLVVNLEGQTLLGYSSEGTREGDCTAVGVGDTNGDGVLDLLVGSEWGYLELVSGRNRHMIRGFDPERLVVSNSFAVCGAGDVNGDGHADLAYGLYADGRPELPGLVHVLSGMDGSVIFEHTLAKAQVELEAR